VKLSCCMILKDEGMTVEGTINSARSVVDEFVVGIDSSTVDDTENIVRSSVRDVPLDLYRFDWTGDFSGARNAGIERASGDWILILDGHEYLRKEGAAAIRPALERVADRFDQIHARLYHRPDEYGNPGDFSSQARLIRKASGLRYKHAQHNQIPMGDAERPRAIASADIIIEHLQPESRKLARQKQNQENRPDYFRAIIDKDPEHWWARYYLGVALEDEGDDSGAFEQWHTIVHNAPPTAPRWLTAMFNVVEQLLKRGEFKEAAETCRLAFPTYIDRREPWILLGNAEKCRGNAGEAIRYLNIAAHMPEPHLSHMTLSGPAYSWQPFKELAEAYTMAGNLGAARACADNLAKSIGERIKGRRPKVIYLVDKFGSFTKEIEAHLQETNRVLRDTKYSGPPAEHADVVFAEWCDHNAIAASRNDQIRRLVIRMHGYEMFAEMPDWIRWDNVDALVVPSEALRAFADSRFSLTAQGVEQHVIFNPIDLKRFVFAPPEPNNKVAWLGYMSWRKNISLLCAIASDNPDYEFHLAGTAQDWETRRFLEDRKPDNVIVSPWQSKPEEWLRDKSVVINTSFREGHPLYVLEAMAMGLKPIVFNWPGAEEIYAPEWIFSKPSDVAKMLAAPPEPERYRAWIEERHNPKDLLPKLASVILGE